MRKKIKFDFHYRLTRVSRCKFDIHKNELDRTKLAKKANVLDSWCRDELLVVIFKESLKNQIADVSSNTKFRVVSNDES